MYWLLSVDPYGLAGQWVTDALNPSVYTYEVAPVFTLMEAVVLQEMCHLVGFPSGDGMFCPGGSFANGTAINLARFKYFPDIKVSSFLNCKPKVLNEVLADLNTSIMFLM
jgi:glutamate decarboxylase